MKKTKIFFPYCGETMGGSHLSSLTLIEKLKKKYDVIVGVHKMGIFSKYCKNNKIKFCYLNKNFFTNKNGSLKNIIYSILNFYYFINFIKKNKIDIIHINDFRMLNTWALASYFSGLKKILFHARGEAPNSRIVSFNLFFTTHIICISKFVLSTLSKSNQIKSVIITNPIKVIKSFKKKKLNIIGYVGNFWHRKRSDIFFKFAEKLISKKLKFKFVYIGNISDKDIEFIYSKYPSLKNKLKFTKFLENPYRIMETFKFIICPAEKDGFGRVPLEAAYLNVPCILSFSGAHKEFKDFKLCLFAKKNKASYYLKIYKKALDQNVKKKLINNAMNFNKMFTLPRIHANKVMNIYNK